VSWLAPITASEALPGRGLKCWLACPASHFAGLASSSLQPSGSIGANVGIKLKAVTPATPDLEPAGPSQAQSQSSGDSSGVDGSGPSAASAAAASLAAGAANTASTAGNAATVEVRLAIGNRRLMQEEGVALSPQVGGRGIWKEAYLRLPAHG